MRRAVLHFRLRGPIALAVLGLGIALGLGLSTPADAQLRTPARVDATPLFGEGTLMGEAWGPVLIEVENRTRTDQHGHVEVEVQGWDAASIRRRIPLDVPPHQTRQVIAPIYVRGGGGSVTARFMDGDRRLGSAQHGVEPSQGGSVVVLGDPPRLRGALLDLDVDAYGPAGPVRTRFPIGTVRFEPATGDPLLPEHAVSWVGVKVLVASAPLLARVSQTQRRAIEDWLRAGGRLLVFPRSADDLRDPWLVSLAGPIATDGEPRRTSTLVPDGGVGFGLRCSGQRSEYFGCSAPFGGGRVFVADYDGAAPTAIESGASRRLVVATLAANDETQAATTFGRGGLTPMGSSPESLRASLDPNESFRPALLLVALVLFLYVILVGPLNFRFVAKKGRPTLALLTTPALAAGCVCVLLFVGYLGKGVTMRYRRVELVEAVEGDTRGHARRHTGLFSTRPGRFEIPGGDLHTQVRRSGGASGGPVHTTGTDGERLADFRSGLWETIFLVEDRVVDLGGSLTLERDDTRLAGLQNDTDLMLEDAIIVDTAGAIYAVGDAHPGAHAAIPVGATGVSFYAHSMYMPASDMAESLASVLGGGEEREESLQAMIRLAGDGLIPHDAPVLYARLPASRETLGDIFTAERDIRWIRLRPRLEGQRLRVAAEYEDPGERPPPYPPPPRHAVEEDLSGADGGALTTDAGVEEFLP